MLGQHAQKIGEVIYKEGAEGAKGTEGTEGGKEDVVEAEVVEEDKKA